MVHGLQGYTEKKGMLAIVNSLRNVEGRKSVILFSEGLSLTGGARGGADAPADLFRRVINAANRANVSFYTLDAGGLRVVSPLAASRSAQTALATQRADQNASGGENQSGAPMSFNLENNEDVLRLDPRGGVTRLAVQTDSFTAS